MQEKNFFVELWTVIIVRFFLHSQLEAFVRLKTNPQQVLRWLQNGLRVRFGSNDTLEIGSNPSAN